MMNLSEDACLKIVIHTDLIHYHVKTETLKERKNILYKYFSHHRAMIGEVSLKM